MQQFCPHPLPICLSSLFSNLHFCWGFKRLAVHCAAGLTSSVPGLFPSTAGWQLSDWALPQLHCFWRRDLICWCLFFRGAGRGLYFTLFQPILAFFPSPGEGCWRRWALLTPQWRSEARAVCGADLPAVTPWVSLVIWWGPSVGGRVLGGSLGLREAKGGISEWQSCKCFLQGGGEEGQSVKISEKPWL